MALPKHSPYRNVWNAFLAGKFVLGISNEILEEYEEIISQKTSPLIAFNVIQLLVNSPFVKKIDPHYHFQLIQQDADDNKFVDCAVAANASFIVSNDNHFKVLETIPFPKLNVINIALFSMLLRQYDFYDWDSSKGFMVNEEAVPYSNHSEE